MADSAADRTRRHKRHRRGDHSLCDPARRCEVVEAAERDDPAAVPERSAKAQALWDEMSQLPLGPIERVLLDEACACMDRLALLRSRTSEASMTESRQQVTTLKGLLAEIRKGAGSSGSHAPTAPQAGSQTTEGGHVVDLATSLAARRAAAAGGAPS